MVEDRAELLAQVLAERLPAADVAEREATRYPRYRATRRTLTNTQEARREALREALNGPTRRIPRQRNRP